MGSNFIDPIKTIEDDAPPLDTSDEAYEEMERQERAEELKNLNSLPPTERDADRERIKWVPNVPMTLDTHDIFMAKAEMAGVRPSDFARMIIETVIKDWDTGRELPEDMKIWLLIFQANKNIRIAEEVDRLAMSQESNHVPANDSIIEQLADRTDRDLNHIKERARKNARNYPLLSQITARHQTKKDRCRLWLARTLEKVESVTSGELNTTASEQGYTNNMISECLREGGWMAEKIGKKWFWKRSPIAKLGNSQISSE